MRQQEARQGRLFEDNNFVRVPPTSEGGSTASNPRTDAVDESAGEGDGCGGER